MAEVVTGRAAADPPSRVHVILLNWNNWRETLECLDSLAKSDYQAYRAVVVDNGSADDSRERIAEWALTAGPGGTPLRVVEYAPPVAEQGGVPEAERELAALPGARKLVLIRSGENLGFAGGCNLATRYALAAGSDAIWLLNNDTVVEPEALGASVAFLRAHPEYEGLTPQIRLYSEPGVIWNCGGELTWWGSRRYFFADRPVAEVPRHGHRDITFITGCAPVYRASFFEREGLLSDRFFYAEDDYELSLRLRRRKLRVACLYDAVIYHKVSRTMGAAWRGRAPAMLYIYYLGRFIDLREYWPRPLWRAWRLATLFHIVPLAHLRHGMSWADAWRLWRAILRDSVRLDRVSKATFELALSASFTAEVLGR